ncbi:probable carboxylesterase 120 [Tripterygium wilfordii]|uniref:probable carboxylesterase 120 n=1 Tax=Tripterygium wilfordii TaxID=458696 RepID=UPI0018F841E5|nr:probable carboxylesterase 120 [Tripterygium wilfordii]
MNSSSSQNRTDEDNSAQLNQTLSIDDPYDLFDLTRHPDGTVTRKPRRHKMPIGADRDHEYCNPMVGDGPKLLEKIKLLGWKVLLSTCDGDWAVDRQIQLANMMEEKGIRVERRIVIGDYHGDEATELPKQQKLIIALKDFIFSSIAQFPS